MANKQTQNIQDYIFDIPMQGVGGVMTHMISIVSDLYTTNAERTIARISIDDLFDIGKNSHDIATYSQIEDIRDELSKTEFRQVYGKEDYLNACIEYHDYGTGEQKTYKIAAATPAKAGAMSGQQCGTLDTLSNYLNSIQYLGPYSSEEEFLSALDERAKNFFDDNSILVGTYENGISNCSFVLAQSGVGYSDIRQILFNKGKVFHRDLHYDEKNNLQMKEDWQFLFGDRLQWSTESHKYVLSQFGQGFNHNITDPVPLATSSVDGLMSKEDKGNFESMKVKIKELEARIAALEAK